MNPDLQIIGIITFAFVMFTAIWIQGTNPMAPRFYYYLWQVVWRLLLCLTIVGIVFAFTGPKRK